MAATRKGSPAESDYFVLLNTLKEAGIKMKALDVSPDTQEALLEVIDRCQADFDRRFR